MYYKLKVINNILILLLLTNPAQAGFDDLWRQRIAREPQEIGVASIYRDHRTATGERFNEGMLTCAHQTRPLCSLSEAQRGICPARSMVTVRLAGKAVECRINDRGPFVRGRVIDLTQGAANRLGLTWKQGIARVTLD